MMPGGRPSMLADADLHRTAQRAARATCLVLLAALLAGCTMTLIPRSSTSEELAWTCTRTGGWWRPEIVGGYCEYETTEP
jgi:hypothetical protein